jgi:hypothetical protein
MEMVFAGRRRQTGQAVVRPAATRTPPGAPSWGRVLATTISLWTSRRLSRLRQPRSALIAAICVLVVAAAAVGLVRLTGTSPPASPAAGPHRAPAQPAAPLAPEQVQAQVQSQAAAWIAGQVSSNATIACDPGVCTALGARGVAATRLVPLSAGVSGALDTSVATAADVIVASGPARAPLGREAPGLLASFGAGDTTIDVRAAAPGGAAAYQAAVKADQAARQSGGAQLLHSKRIQVDVQGTGQLQAGQVDSRLLIMLAMLASQHPWRVVAFGGASPGAPAAEAPLRQVTIADTAGRGGLADLDGALAMMRAQQGPYHPAHVGIVRLDGGQQGLSIDFAAPTPLGLLSGGASG